MPKKTTFYVLLAAGIICLFNGLSRLFATNIYEMEGWEIFLALGALLLVAALFALRRYRRAMRAFSETHTCARCGKAVGKIMPNGLCTDCARELLLHVEAAKDETARALDTAKTITGSAEYSDATKNYAVDLLNEAQEAAQRALDIYSSTYCPETEAGIEREYQHASLVCSHVSRLISMREEKARPSSTVANVHPSLEKGDYSTDSSIFQKTLESLPRVDIKLSESKANQNAQSNMPDIRFYNVTRRTNLEKLFPLVVIDTETTGLKPRINEIVEVSAIRYEAGFMPVSCFTTLLRPHKRISPEASAVNKITDDMVRDQPYFSQIADAFSEYISGCTIVGHNLGFDLKFLCHGGAQFSDNVKYIDTLELAKHTLTSRHSKRWDMDSEYSSGEFDYDVENYKLGTLCDYYGIIQQNAHRSLDDCLATGMVLERLIEDKTK